MGKLKVVDNTIHSVKIFLYKIENNQKKFLLLGEPEGIYGFIGGAQDSEDKTLTDTAWRELREEVGLTKKSCKLTKTPITHDFVHSDPNSSRYGIKGKLHAFIGVYNGCEPISLESELTGYLWTDDAETKKHIADSYDYFSIVFEKILQIVG